MNMIDRFSIRTAQTRDFVAVNRLFGESYPILLRDAYPDDLLTKALPLISRAQPDLVRSGQFFLVHRGSRLVGAGGWTRGAPGSGARSPGLGHVRHVVSDHRMQRQGIGRRLLDYVMINAQGDGLRALLCLSTLNAVPFYEAMGFVAQGPEDLILPGGIAFPAIRMRADL